MSAPGEQEKLLLRKCIEGNGDAWRDFIQNYSPLVYYAIQKVIKSKSVVMSSDQVADLHNDVFLSLMERQGRKLRQYEGKNGCSVSTWVRVIAVRLTIDFLRKQREILSISDEGPLRAAERKTMVASGAQEALERKEEKERLAALINELSPKDQLFIKLFYYEERSPQEIARVLGTTPNAVYSRGNYLREKLKKALHKKKSKIV